MGLSGEGGRGAAGAGDAKGTQERFISKWRERGRDFRRRSAEDCHCPRTVQGCAVCHPG